MKPRSMALGIAMVATLAASWWAIHTDEPPAAPSPRELASPRADRDMQSGAPIARAGAEDLLNRRREPWPAWAAGLFQPLPVEHSPQQQSPPPVQAAPTAPPVPFRYVGEIQDGGGRAVILTEGDDVHIVRARQRIGDLYRVDRISATEVELTYLPLMQRQRIATSTYEQYQ